MLTTHAFNAMLKTLEEPPPHLKFILATTDPQKIPVTVLSRCIQYNLKQMSPEAVVEHLQHLLNEEGVAYEKAALQLIARGAAGSMRDALSLTDQAIAFSGNRITVQAMQDMLGTIDQSYLVNLINALLAGDATQVVAIADAIAERGYSYEGALADMAVLLSRIAMEQRLAGAIDSDDPLYPELAQIVQGANHDLLQLFYTIAVHGRKELALAPDEYSGFVMICLRMLALVNTPVVQAQVQQAMPITPVTRDTPSANPEADADADAKKKHSELAAVPEPIASNGISPVEESTLASPPTIESAEADEEAIAVVDPVEEVVPQHESTATPTPPESGTEQVSSASVVNHQQEVPPAATGSAMSEADWLSLQSHAIVDYEGDVIDEPLSSDVSFDPGWEPAVSEQDNKITLSSLNQERWIELTRSLKLSGLAGELLLNSQWLATKDNTIYLRIFLKNVDSLAIKSTLTTVLTEYFAQVVKLHFEAGETGDATARAQLLREQEARQLQAEQRVANDPYIQSLKDSFGANVVEGSVRVLSSE